MYKDPSSPHPCQQLLSHVFSVTVIIAGMKLYLTEVLIWISLISDVERFFMYLLAISVSSEKMSFAYFLINHFLVLEFFICFGYKPLIRCTVCKYFLPFHIFYLHFVVFFAVQKLFSSMQYYLSIFVSVANVFGTTQKNFSKGQCQETFPLFSFNSFIASGLKV